MHVRSIFLFSMQRFSTTRLVLLAMGEVLYDGFNLAVSSPSDSRGREACICIVAIKDKKFGGFTILIGSIPLHHVILLKVLLRSS